MVINDYAVVREGEKMAVCLNWDRWDFWELMG